MPYLGQAPANKVVQAADIADNVIGTDQIAQAALTITGDVTIAGTTPVLTVGDAGTEDAAIVFDGNAQDFHIGLDDTADDLVIGLGSALGTTTHMSFDEAGIIGMPLQPGCSVHLDGHQSVTSETWTKLLFALELYDINNDFASNKFTVPVDGIYLVIVRASAQMADADVLWGAIRINGSETIRSMSDSSMTSNISPVCSAVIDLDATDYIEGFAYHNFGAGAQNITGAASPSYTHMMVHKLA